MPVDSPRNPLGVLFAAFNGFQRTAALKAAIDLDLFTAIGEGRTTPSELAQRCGASERGLRMLCDSLAALGFVRKDGGHYALDPDLGMLLDRHSPAYVGSAANFLASPMVTEAFGALTAAVRKGGTAVAEGALAPEHPIWVDFARSMAPLAGLSARLLANLLDAPAGAPWKVLDIAAGHGMFGIALAQENPNARIVALDWANVLAVAHENARAAGVADRFRTLPGSALTVDYGQGYDLVLLTNFLHHFDVETCEVLLRRVHAALAPGGRAVTLEFIPDEDRISPAEAATFALVMLAMTPRGDAYTFSEYEHLFRRAGFARSELRDLPPSVQRVVISYR